MATFLNIDNVIGMVVAIIAGALIGILLGRLYWRWKK